MSTDRFIEWGEPPEWGPPTIERLARVAQDFLGERWAVRQTSASWIVCECADKQTFPLRSERRDIISTGRDAGLTYGEVLHREEQRRTRGFEISFPRDRNTSVITRQADEFTSAVADQFTRLIARWWNGEIKWPT